MENQPMQPSGTSPETPTNPNPGESAAPTTPATTPTETATPPTGLPATGDVILEAGKKKRKKGLIITLVSILIVLLIGGGAFAAAYIINNQPANIIMSALGNFFNSEQVAVDGSIDLALQDSEELGVESLSIDFDEKNSGLSSNTTATLNVNFSNGASALAIEFGEVMLNNGVLYIEASGLKDFYDQAFRDNIKTTLINQALYGYQSNSFDDCYITDDTEEVKCVEEITIDPDTEAAVSQAIDEILNQIGKIIDSIDGEWIEISIDDIMNSEMFATTPSNTRQALTDSYKCTTDTLNQISNYSSEFSDLYSQNPFIDMTAGNDSFYNISFDSTKLAGYLNGTSNTKFANDLASCFNANIYDTTSNITADDVAEILQYLPQISAKFDGIFDHHLTELKMTEQNDYYSLTSDLKFSYPDNVTIVAPPNSRPLMDVVNEVYQGLEVLQSLYTL